MMRITIEQADNLSINAVLKLYTTSTEILIYYAVKTGLNRYNVIGYKNSNIHGNNTSNTIRHYIIKLLTSDEEKLPIIEYIKNAELKRGKKVFV